MTIAKKRAATYLLVEDDDSHAYIIRRCFQLEKTSCRLNRVKSGEECLAYLDAEEPYADRSRFPYPDVVILDIRMPGLLDGVRTLEAIRADPRHRELPVTMLTASLRDLDVSRCAELGVDGYIVKSDDPGQMLEGLRGVQQRFA